MSKTPRHCDHFHCTSKVYNLNDLDNIQLTYPRTYNVISNEQLKIYQGKSCEGDVMPQQKASDDVDRNLSGEHWFEKTYNSTPNGFSSDYCSDYHDCPPNPVMNAPRNDWNRNNWYNKNVNPKSKCM
jgi:hypothetical protein